MANKRTIKYSEPDNYFPESIRKEHKLGEYAEDETESTNDSKNNRSQQDNT